MRPDYVLYAMAAIFFMLIGITYLHHANYKELYMVVSTVLGLFFIGLGYTQRPKTTTQRDQDANSADRDCRDYNNPSYIRRRKSIVKRHNWELTEIKGIGTKRAEQLKALGITNIEDLAKSPAEDLASKLKVSQKITKRWIEDAKSFLRKPRRRTYLLSFQSL